jgi:prepilin-type processing-associated H-X9-DG protein
VSVFFQWEVVMRLMRILVLAMVMVSGALATQQSRAQALADRVPSDALLYVAWAGAGKLAPAYAQSHLKGVLDASNAPELFSELGPRIVRRIQLEQMLQGDPVAKELLPTLLSLGESMWASPTALYVGPLDLGGKVPMPKVALLCQAGKNAQALADSATKLVAEIPEGAPFKIKVQVWGGDLLVISNCEMAERVEESLSQREQFAAAMKQCRPDPAIVAYFDAEKVLNVASLAINMGAPDQAKKMWQRALLTTGIAGIKRLVYTAGFDGKDWGSQAFVEAPQPRMGLLASLLDSQPVSDDLLKMAPKSSSWVAASRLDLAKLVSDLRNAVSRMDPNAARHVEEVMGQVNQTLGLDVQKDLLASLGDQWLAFNSDQTGHGLLGMSVANPLRDSARLEKTLSSLEKMANAAMAKENEDGDGPTFAFETTKIGDVTVHYFAVPAIAPCWAIKNNTLYFALFPQILAAATEGAGGGESILANEDFNAARKRLDVTGKAISLSYMDLPRLAPRGYQMVLALQRGGLGFADMFGLQTPAMVLPPLNKIQPHLAASISATWIDDAGWHYRGVSPFPGSDLLGGEQALVTTVAPVAAAALIPATARAQQQAVMVRDMNNLRQIGLGAIMYSNDNQGALPPDLGATLKYVQAPAVYLSPDKAAKLAPPADAKPEELAKWINENADYAYLGKDLGKLTKITNPAQTILAHEKFELTKNGLVNVLYADGHVEMMSVQFLKDRLEQQKKPAGAAQ